MIKKIIYPVSVCFFILINGCSYFVAIKLSGTISPFFPAEVYELTCKSKEGVTIEGAIKSKCIENGNYMVEIVTLNKIPSEIVFRTSQNMNAHVKFTGNLRQANAVVSEGKTYALKNGTIKYGNRVLNALVGDSIPIVLK